MNKKVKQSRVKTVVRAIKDGRFDKAKKDIDKNPEVIDAVHRRSGKSVRQHIPPETEDSLSAHVASKDKAALAHLQGNGKKTSRGSGIL